MMPDLRDGSSDYDLPASADILRNAYTPYGAQRALNTDTGDDTPTVTPDARLSIERGWLSQVADETTAVPGHGPDLFERPLLRPGRLQVHHAGSAAGRDGPQDAGPVSVCEQQPDRVYHGCVRAQACVLLPVMY